jgi:hypothetical protein
VSGDRTSLPGWEGTHAFTLPLQRMLVVQHVRSPDEALARDAPARDGEALPPSIPANHSSDRTRQTTPGMRLAGHRTRDSCARLSA